MKWADRNGLQLNTKKMQLLLLGRKRRERALSKVRVSIREEVVERSKCVNCLGVMLDDGLTWREQVQYVRKRCFIGLSKLRRLRNVEQKNSSITLWYSPPRLLLSCMAGMFKGTETATGEGAELWHATHTI